MIDLKKGFRHRFADGSVYPATRRELNVDNDIGSLFPGIDPGEKPNTGANDRLLRFGKGRPIRNSSRTSFLIKSVYLYVRIKQREPV